MEESVLVINDSWQNGVIFCRFRKYNTGAIVISSVCVPRDLKMYTELGSNSQLYYSPEQRHTQFLTTLLPIPIELTNPDSNFAVGFSDKILEQVNDFMSK